MTVITQELKQAWKDWLENIDGDFDTQLNCGLAAEDWMNAGVYPSEREKFLDVGGFCPEACVELLTAEIPFQAVSRRPSAKEIEKYSLPFGCSLAYLYCDGALSLEQLQEILD